MPEYHFQIQKHPDTYQEIRYEQDIADKFDMVFQRGDARNEPVEQYPGEKGPETIHGCGNYVVPVYGADHKTTKALLYCIDSNDYPESKDYGTYDWIHFDQVTWYRQTSARFTKENGGNPLPALAFFHIALPEYDAIPNNGTMLGEKNEGSGASKINSGLFASFIEMGDVMGAFVGHDHDNDFIGTHYQIALAYGRVTGTDAYGDLERGMRVIELKENERSFDTWVRTPSKKGDIFYYPSGLTSLDEEQMSYLPATTTKAGKPGVTYTYYEGKFKSTADVLKAQPVKEGTFRNFSIKEAADKLKKESSASVLRRWIDLVRDRFRRR